MAAAALRADQGHWEVVTATTQESENVATWSFTLRNISDHDLRVGEDWQTKGHASVNLNWGEINVYSEPCHHPQSHVTVKSDGIIKAVIPALSSIDPERLKLAIIEGGERVVIAPISKIEIKVR